MAKLTDLNRFSIKYPQIALEWHPDLNGNYKPCDFSYGSHYLAWWKCLLKKHNYQATIKDRCDGNGCSYCSNKKVCIDNCLETLFPEIAKEWDYEINFPLTPKDVVAGSRLNAGWVCKFGHKWKISLNQRTGKDKTGCPRCAGQEVCLENCLATLRPHLIKEWHSAKNGTITPYNVTAFSQKKYWWICEKGHEYESVVASKSNGTRCPNCCNKTACLDNCLATLRPDLALEWDKDNEVTPYGITCGSNLKVGWNCKFGHKWDATVWHRNNGESCPYCNGSKVCIDNCLATKRPDLALEWDKNNKLAPFDVTCGSNEKVDWFCKFGHVFNSSVKNRVKGHGCPLCNESKGEKEVAKILTKLNIKFKRQWKEHFCRNKRKLPFDFYLEDYNRCIEYQGLQHYEPIERFGGLENLKNVQKRDLIKFNYCLDNKIPLLRIPCWDFDKIESLIQEFLRK